MQLLQLCLHGTYLNYMTVAILCFAAVSCPAPFHARGEKGSGQTCIGPVSPVQRTVRQSDAWIKSHDCAGMHGMHINDCAHARARSYEIIPLVPNGMLINSRFLFTHTRNT